MGWINSLVILVIFVKIFNVSCETKEFVKATGNELSRTTNHTELLIKTQEPEYPPTIVNRYLEKTFDVDEGDSTFRIQCNAIGSPKPTILWKKDGLNIALGTKWYDMAEDGTLIFKDIDYKTQGKYVCQAENKMGQDTATYYVFVKQFPREPSMSTIFVSEGQTIHLKCGIPHTTRDSLRWYKDGKMIKFGELKLYSVSKHDAGLYSCHVRSNFEKPRSMQVKVKIEFKPTFISDAEENIDFYLDNVAYLDCEANGVPKPKVTWKHNGKIIDGITEMTYPVEMKFNTRGVYECEVSNRFGSIHRSFKITSRDCVLDTKTDFPYKQPLMVSKSATWPTYELVDGYMIVPNGDYFFLSCRQSRFENLPFASKVMVYCHGETQVQIDGEIYNFAEIKCKEEVKPDLVKTGKKCLPGNTELINVAYRLFVYTYVKVYDICMDKDNNVPLFTKHELSPDHIDTLRESEWLNSDMLPLNFDTIYDCKQQIDDITSILRKDLRAHNSCCFARRQLVNARDLRSGIPATASSTYLNVIPHWSTCNSKNWDDVENRVRNLVKGAGRDLLVYTGTAKKLRMPALSGLSMDISLRDGRGGSQPVAEYLWKVVQDQSSSSSLAIVQVNVPDLSPSEAHKHVLCNDICSDVDWMNSTNWDNVEDGFTYCCDITEFETAFGYKGSFNNGMKKVLSDASISPEHYLT